MKVQSSQVSFLEIHNRICINMKSNLINLDGDYLFNYLAIHMGKVVLLNRTIRNASTLHDWNR